MIYCLNKLHTNEAETDNVFQITLYSTRVNIKSYDLKTTYFVFVHEIKIK